MLYLCGLFGMQSQAFRQFIDETLFTLFSSDSRHGVVVVFSYHDEVGIGSVAAFDTYRTAFQYGGVADAVRGLAMWQVGHETDGVAEGREKRHSVVSGLRICGAVYVLYV